MSGIYIGGFGKKNIKQQIYILFIETLVFQLAIQMCGEHTINICLFLFIKMVCFLAVKKMVFYLWVGISLVVAGHPDWWAGSHECIPFRSNWSCTSLHYILTGKR